MSLIVKGLSMPKNCNECRFRSTFCCKCYVSEDGSFRDISTYNKKKRHPDCPLEEYDDSKREKK